MARRVPVRVDRRALARGGIAVAALLVGAQVVRTGVARMADRGDPAVAAQLAPENGRFAADAAQAKVAAGAHAGDPAVRALVAAALARDLTQTQAIELKALDVSQSGDSRREARLFHLSDTISRRSLPTRLWLIQRAVDAGSVPDTLRQFDIALRTSTKAPPVLFPVLAKATRDPDLVAPIARMIDRPGEWQVAFLTYAAGRGDAAGTAGLLLHMRDRMLVRGNDIDQQLIQRLARQGEFALARRVDDVYGPRRAPGMLLRDPDFAPSPARFPFGWQMADGGDANAVRSLVGNRPVLAFSAPTARMGQATAQLLTLAPGRYRLATTVMPTTGADRPPFWALVCGEEGGAELARLELPGGGSAAVDFVVPSGCAAQWLTLNLRPTGTTGGQSGAVLSVRVVPR